MVLMAQCENDVINMGLFFFLFGIHTNSEHLPVTHEHHPVLWKRLELARIAPETTLPGPRRNGNPDSPDPSFRCHRAALPPNSVSKFP
jgi:hypothetical protein